MCIYISIGIYKISAAKKRANRTQKEYTHTAKARRRAIPQRRERAPPREARTQQHPTQHVADCRTILIQFFRRGVSPTRACSRAREHLRDFASFQKLHENHRQRSRGRLTLVICVIMTRDSSPPPLAKPHGGLIFQGFLVAVPFPHSFTSSFQPSQFPSPPPTLKSNLRFQMVLRAKLLFIGQIPLFNYNLVEIQIIIRSGFALFAPVVLSGTLYASRWCSFIPKY